MGLPLEHDGFWKAPLHSTHAFQRLEQQSMVKQSGMKGCPKSSSVSHGSPMKDYLGLAYISRQVTIHGPGPGSCANSCWTRTTKRHSGSTAVTALFIIRLRESSFGYVRDPRVDRARTPCVVLSDS